MSFSPRVPRSTSILRRMSPDEVFGLRTMGLTEIYGRGDLVVLGLGVMIGAGIFSIAGRQAATTAGPGVFLSFMIAGITSLLAALCYAELVSSMPVSGSAYTFSYVVFGEVWAWIVGWALILEMELAAAVVARAWSLYAVQTLTEFGVSLPGLITGAGGFDPLSMVILVALTGAMAFNARVGLRVLWVMVAAKLLAIGAVIVVGAVHFDAANLARIPAPVAPSPGGGDALHTTLVGLLIGETHSFGWFGIIAAAPAIAFAYIGFDVVATAAEETKDAPRTVPDGMIRSLALTTLIYLAVAIVMVGMVAYTAISTKAPLADAFDRVGEGFMVHVINIGAVLGLTTVILVLLVGQTRVVFSMARDGLLPHGLSRLSGPHATPLTATLVIGAVAVLLAGFLPVLTLEQLVIIGTMVAFMSVAAGVLRMRRMLPDLPRPFRVPFAPVVPALSMAATLWLMVNLEAITWVYFTLWTAFGLLVYLLYGRRHSLLAPNASNTPHAPHGRGRHRR
ncbi:amino acid permease [Microtetraspora sp. AC03309]|uniref:amino acid permease n=1 Tax=Microtetraspora sp. AC03309 TaxID=2779376 RepID=UPI001E65665D|nr:amino acid permease [Microtetraspora sp. AC03309]